MGVIIGILGLLQMFGGFTVSIAAKTSIHEILGAISFGMGVMALGIGVVIAKADRQVRLLQKLTEQLPERSPPA